MAKNMRTDNSHLRSDLHVPVAEKVGPGYILLEARDEKVYPVTTTAYGPLTVSQQQLSFRVLG